MAGTLAELVARQGGIPVAAPALWEIPLGDNPDAQSFADGLLAVRFDLVIFETGVGVRYLAESLEPRIPRAGWAEALRRAKVVARGPKPAAALREFGVSIDLQVPEPNTWRETLALLDARLPIAGLRVVVQEYGKPVPELTDGLERRGRRGDPRAGLPLGVARGHRSPPRRLDGDRRTTYRRRAVYGGATGRACAPGRHGREDRGRGARCDGEARGRRLYRTDDFGLAPRTACRLTSSQNTRSRAISSPPSRRPGGASIRQEPAIDQAGHCHRNRRNRMARERNLATRFSLCRPARR